MSVLEKYQFTSKPPKMSRKLAKPDPIEGVRRKFLVGAAKQKAQAQTWKPGAKDLRSWVTRDETRDLAWVTVKYGVRPVPLKGTTRSTIGPVRLNELPEVFEDIERAARAGDLDKVLIKVATRGSRKKGQNKAA